ncbi:MAG: cytochrome c [bacterium]|nr:cytochrome c [bacterium]
MRSSFAFVRALVALVTLLVLSPVAARAVPVFANGQGVSCETCHTTFPGMTRYGMMVMMSNFQILNEHLQNQALPLAVRLYITSHLANAQNPGDTSVSDLSFLGGGFLGKNFTWYGEQHVIDGGSIGATEQLWVSWNGLLHGLNSLQVGKFHTPFPFMPAHAWTIGDYLLATQTTGQNDFNPNDARWGLAFNGMSNEFMYNFSYLTGTDTIGNAFDYNAADNARTLDANISYGGMSQPWSVGLVAMRGFAPLHDATNTFVASDAFTREGAYFGYQTSRWHLQTMYYHGFDAHPDLGTYDVPLNGATFEVGRDLGWRNHLLVRYDVASSDTLSRQLLFDYAHNVQPNLALIGEVLTGPQQRPQFSLQLAFAGPYQLGKRYLLKRQPTAGAYVEPAGGAGDVAAPSAQSATPAPRGDANAGAKLVASNGCQGCHGAAFQGNIGPKLVGIEHILTPDAIAHAIAQPRAPMPNFGFTAAQIDDIVAYLSGLDGGASGSRPVVTFDPSPPSLHATISIRFAGAIPNDVHAAAVMQMGSMQMAPVTIALAPTSDPHVLRGSVVFSMGGPWTVHITYGGTTMDVPVTVGD